MPWETRAAGSAGSDSETVQSIFDLLGSDPEFADDEEPAAKKPKSDDQESDDSEDETVDEDEKEVDEEEVDEEEFDDESEEIGSEDEEEGDEDVYIVKVNGADVEVTIEEALQGYSRQEDYTRKTQQLATDRQKLEAELASDLNQTRQVREALGQQLVFLERALAEDGTPPDWEALRREDPEKFSNEYAAYQLRQDKLKQVREAQERLAADQDADLKRAMQTRLIEERNKLTEAIPEFKDEKALAEGLGNIQAYLTTTYGAKPDELETVFDHRFVDMARKAMLWDESQTTGKDEIRRKKKGVRVLKPGTATPTKKSRKGKASTRKVQERTRKRLARSGNVVDAAAALLALEDE
jgi:hypothetical protein